RGRGVLYRSRMWGGGGDRRRRWGALVEERGGGVGVRGGPPGGGGRGWWARPPPAILLANPDILHRSLLPDHRRWRHFLSGLDVVVLDELHSYRGVFGTHVALVLRRIRRLAALDGGAPRFIAASATILNPTGGARRRGRGSAASLPVLASAAARRSRRQRARERPRRGGGDLQRGVARRLLGHPLRPCPHLSRTHAIGRAAASRTRASATRQRLQAGLSRR